MATDLERAIVVALQKIFGSDADVGVSFGKGQATIIVRSPHIVSAGRADADPVRLAGAIRDVIRARYTREEVAVEARRRGQTVEQFERHLAAQHLRDLDTLGAGPAPRRDPAPVADTLPPALLTRQDRAALVAAKRKELENEFGAETLMFHCGRNMTIDQLAESLVDHPLEG